LARHYFGLRFRRKRIRRPADRSYRMWPWAGGVTKGRGNAHCEDYSNCGPCLGLCLPPAQPPSLLLRKHFRRCERCDCRSATELGKTFLASFICNYVRRMTREPLARSHIEAILAIPEHILGDFSDVNVAKAGA
jgi:hypothetical protein